LRRSAGSCAMAGTVNTGGGSGEVTGSGPGADGGSGFLKACWWQ